MHKILIKNNQDNSSGSKVFDKYYYTWKKYEAFQTHINQVYRNNGNKWPDKYLYPSWVRKELDEEYKKLH